MANLMGARPWEMELWSMVSPVAIEKRQFGDDRMFMSREIG